MGTQLLVLYIYYTTFAAWYKVYVGSTTRTLFDRFKEHLAQAASYRVSSAAYHPRDHPKKLYMSMVRYGLHDFVVLPLQLL